MEIVLNFDRKEIVIKDNVNIRELYKRLKGLLAKDLENWVFTSDAATWYYPILPTYPWPRYEVDAGDYTTSVYCLSDEATTECVVDGKDLQRVLKN